MAIATAQAAGPIRAANAPSYDQRKALSIKGVPVYVILAVTFWLPALIFTTIDVILDRLLFWWLWW